jgi:tripeptidyl-peptidase-1
MSNSLSWIKFNATVEEAETLLQTQYSIYTNTDTGKDHLACEEYSVPAHLKRHIDFITPTIHFDAIVKQKKQRRGLDKRTVAKKPVPQIQPNPNAADAAAVTYSLANCDEYITPDCLRALYNFTNGTLAL